MNYGFFPQANSLCQKPVLSCGPNPVFFLIVGMGAKTIRGSNHSLNHIGFLHTKHFPWEATRRRALGGWRLDEYGSIYICSFARKKVSKLKLICTDKSMFLFLDIYVLTVDCILKKGVVPHRRAIADGK